MILKLIKMAQQLDKKGFIEEADTIDRIIKTADWNQNHFYNNGDHGWEMDDEELRTPQWEANEKMRKDQKPYYSLPGDDNDVDEPDEEHMSPMSMNSETAGGITSFFTDPYSAGMSKGDTKNFELETLKKDNPYPWMVNQH